MDAKFLSIAKELKAKYRDAMEGWGPPTLALWLRDKCRCVYCNDDMLNTRDSAYHTWSFDHLMPKKIYPELALCEGNKVLACRRCNAFKGLWDPNTEGGGRIVFDELPPIDSERLELIRRCKTHFDFVKHKQDIESRFKSEQELIRAVLNNLSKT